MSLFLLACPRRKPNEKEEEQYPSARMNCWNFDLSTRGIPSLLPELIPSLTSDTNF
jgi:hypothetical protein